MGWPAVICVYNYITHLPSAPLTVHEEYVPLDLEFLYESVNFLSSSDRAFEMRMKGHDAYRKI